MTPPMFGGSKIITIFVKNFIMGLFNEGGLFDKIGNALGNIAPIIPLAGTALDYFSNASTNKANMKLAQYQNQWNLDMWNRQNEYNSPLQQMQRLKDAGLNPNMVYGNGSAANQAGALHAAEAPRLQAYTSFQNAGSAVANSLLSAQQIKNLEQQNVLLKIDARSKQQQIIRDSIAMSKELLANRAYREDYAASRELKQLAVKAARSNIAHTDMDTNRLSQDVQYTQARVQLAKMQNLMSKAQYTRILRLLPIEIKKLSAEATISAKMAKDYDDYGVRPTDPLWARVLAKLLPEAGVGATEEIRKRLEQIGDDASWNDIKNAFPE